MSHSITTPTVLVLPLMKENARRKPTQTGTNVIIRVGPNLIASANLGGKYTVEQGLKEFKRGNTKFRVPPNMQAVADAIRASK